MKQIKKDLSQRFGCLKCHGRGAHVEEVTLPVISLARIPPVSTEQYLAATCSLCGFTEFYNLAVMVRSHSAATQKIKPVEKPGHA